MAGKNYIIKPPPEEKGKEPLYRVVYEIDVNAPNEVQAAKEAWKMMRAEGAYDPVLTLINHKGKQTQIDLAWSKKD